MAIKRHKPEEIVAKLRQVELTWFATSVSSQSVELAAPLVSTDQRSAIFPEGEPTKSN